MANILIVDDEINILKLTSLLIKQNGHQTWTAENGRQAAEILKQQTNIDLVLTDLIMPEVNGFELCQQFGDTYPIVIVSAMCKELKPEQPFATKAIDYINKPFDIGYLQKRIQLYLHKFKKNPDYQPEKIKIGNLEFNKGENILLKKNALQIKTNLPVLRISQEKDFFLENIINQSEALGQNIHYKNGGLRIFENINFNNYPELITVLNRTNLAFGDITGIFLTEKDPSDIIQRLFDHCI